MRLCLSPSEDFIEESSEVDEPDTDEESELESDGSEGAESLGTIFTFSFFSRSPLRGVSTIESKYADTFFLPPERFPSSEPSDFEDMEVTSDGPNPPSSDSLPLLEDEEEADLTLFFSTS